MCLFIIHPPKCVATATKWVWHTHISLVGIDTIPRSTPTVPRVGCLGCCWFHHQILQRQIGDQRYTFFLVRVERTDLENKDRQKPSTTGRRVSLATNKRDDKILCYAIGKLAMALHSSIFREAPYAASDSLSFTYSADTDSSCSGIETWISDQRRSPEILWEDQSMRLFRFRQANHDANKTSTGMVPKTKVSFANKTSLSYEKYRMQYCPETHTKDTVGQETDAQYVNSRSSRTHSSNQLSQNSQVSKSRSISSELASTWLQMGQERRHMGRSTRSVGDTSSSASSTASSLSCHGVSFLPSQNGSPVVACQPNLDLTDAKPAIASSNPSVSSNLVSAYRPYEIIANPNAEYKSHMGAQDCDYTTPSKKSQRLPTQTQKRSQTQSQAPLRSVGINAKCNQDPPAPKYKSSSVQVGHTSKLAPLYPKEDARGLFRHKITERSNRLQQGGTDPRRRRSRPNNMTAQKNLWCTAVDPASGRTYYYHSETRETQWRKPLELATDEEKEEMRVKEERQRNFFAAMEANILKNLESGAMLESTQNAAETETETAATFLQTRVVEGSPMNRPELIRTISSMDSQIISELVKRQPSNRNLFDDKSPTDVLASKFSTGYVGRETLTDQTKTLSLSDFSVEEFRVGENSRALSEESLGGRRESLGSILRGLPEDVGFSTDFGKSYLGAMGVSSFFNEESLDDLGITEEEMQALTQLAQITDQMSVLPELLDSDEEATSLAQQVPVRTGSVVARASVSVKRASMASLSLDVLQEQNELSEHCTEEPSPSAEEINKKERDEVLANVVDADAGTAERPKMVRRNTCGTIYVGSTMSAPDKDATIKCVCGVFRAHILQSQKCSPAPIDEYLIFNDLEDSQRSSKSQPADPPPPSLEEITAFYRDVFRRSQMESDCIIMSLIYVERLIRRTQGLLRPRSSNWRSILFSCMILASKVWDDLSMWNADFSQTCPTGVRFPLQRINELEVALLSALSYDVKVPASEYAKYYFLLRSMLIKSGLGSEALQTLNPLDLEGAKRLQQMSARYQARQAPRRPMLLSRSVSEANTGSKWDQRAQLEHMVEL